jgi:hypothetical protein
MNPISLMHLHTLLLPSPRSHWSATGPRSKTQQSNTRNTQRKTTRALAARVKPVRPLSETGHTGFAQGAQTQRPKTRANGLEPWRNLDQSFFSKRRLVPRRSPAKHTFDQTGQTGFANQSHRFHPENPQRTTRPKTK